MARDATLRRELAGIVWLVLAVFLSAALVSFAVAPSGRDGADTVAIRGSVGAVGALLAGPLIWLVGWAGAVIVPALPAVHALRVFGRLGRRADRDWLLFLAGLVLIVPAVVGLALGIGRDESAAAGLWGAGASFYLARWFGALGAWLVVLLALSVLAAATLAWNPLRAVLHLRRPRLLHRDDAPGDAASAVDASSDAPVRKPPRRGRGAVGAPDLAAALEPSPEEMPAIQPSLARDVADHVADPAADARRGRKRSPGAEPAAERVTAELNASDALHTTAASDSLPPFDFLTRAPEKHPDAGRRELDAAGVKLMDALRTFRIDGQLVGRTTGPTVTQFEIEPAPGVKVRQIASLADDLALAMRAPSIRIVAPIPGKGAVGVEVPNPTPEMVAFRDIVDSRDFQQARAALPVALGKDLEGRPVIADLAKMPHLLIAGATGSGKSVCVNTIITSLLYRHTPETLRFLMVDPKMVELSVYNDLPHLRHKVITDNRDAAAVLKWAVMEMNERYALLAANACRNVQDFNKRVRAARAGEGPALLKPRDPSVAFEDRTYTRKELPYIVVIIDEMADLMMTVQGEVETPIAMLAQKARAIGIHLILATQRPSVNVITGLIKANFPSRIAFRVASQIDSRTIIDGGGAEALLGNGDMLFIPPGKSEPERLQGAYLSSEDTERLMGWYRDAKAGTSAAGRALADEVDAAPEEDILDAVRRKIAAEAGDPDDGPINDGGERDKLFREAAEVCIQNQSGSTSLLQRRLNVGYGRAARIVDQLVEAGVLDERGSSKGRDVLLGSEDLDRIVAPRA